MNFPKSRISIHALRAEGDPNFAVSLFTNSIFLSTPSVRRATQSIITHSIIALYFYPRPPCGGRPIPQGEEREIFNISIHALRAEGDLMWKN